MFEDRADAGLRLADALAHLDGEEVVVLAIPRGGVEVGAEVARLRGWPLDVVIPRKVGAPGNPELALGAVAPGIRVLNTDLIARLRVPEEFIADEVRVQEEEIRRRAEAYRGGRPPADVSGRVAVVVDDGVATGSTAIASLRWARAQGASRVILAVPVGPPDVFRVIGPDADEVICLETPEPFYAVGQWYRAFDQTSDDEVVRLLEEAHR